MKIKNGLCKRFMLLINAQLIPIVTQAIKELHMELEQEKMKSKELIHSLINRIDRLEQKIIR